MKGKDFLLFLFFFIILSSYVYAENIKIDFPFSSTEVINYTELLKTAWNTTGNSSVIAYDVTNEYFNELKIYQQYRGDTHNAILDSGNITLDINGLNFNKISQSSATGTTNAIIELDLKDSYYVTDTTYMTFLFGNLTDNSIMDINLCDNNYCYANGISTGLLFNINIDAVYNNSNYSFPLYTEVVNKSFNKIIIGFHSDLATTYDWINIRQINFTTVSNVDINKMPEVNFSANVSCYNSTNKYFDNYTIYPSLSTYDPEGDQIYFKYMNNLVKDYSTFNKLYFTTSQYSKDARYNFFNDPFLSYPNTTKICKDYLCSGWVYYGVTPSEYYLAINPLNGFFYYHDLQNIQGSAWNYLIMPTITEKGEIYERLQFPMENTKVNLIVKNIYGENLVNVTLHQYNSSRMFIYKDGTLQSNITIPKKTYLDAEFFLENDKLRFYLYNMTNNGNDVLKLNFNVTLSDNEKISSIGFETPITDSGYIRYWGLNEIQIFNVDATTSDGWTPIENIQSSYQQSLLSNQVKFYITDSIHKDMDKYDIYTLTLNVPMCTENGILPYPTTYNNTKDDFYPDREFFNYLGPYMRNYIKSLDSENLAYNILWYLWVIIYVITIIGLYMETNVLDVMTPLVSSSVLCLILGILIGSISHIVGFAILLAFGLGIPAYKEMTQ